MERDAATVRAAAAPRTDADLVVLGSRGRSDLGVSLHAAAQLRAAVLVLRPRVLVAVDGSAASDEAVTEARRWRPRSAPRCSCCMCGA